MTLFTRHGDLLDEERFDEWLDLFTDDCEYLVAARENVERGLPLATIRCESKGYLKDRVVAVTTTSMYTPRSQRHVVWGGVLGAEAVSRRVVGGRLGATSSPSRAILGPRGTLVVEW